MWKIESTKTDMGEQSLHTDSASTVDNMSDEGVGDDMLLGVYISFQISLKWFVF